MQIGSKNSLLLIGLLFALLISISAVSAGLDDNSTDELVTVDNDEKIAIDGQNDEFNSVESENLTAIEESNDEIIDDASDDWVLSGDEQDSLKHSDYENYNCYIKFDSDEITVKEGEPIVITGNLLMGYGGGNPGGPDFPVNVNLNGVLKYSDLNLVNHKLTFTVPTSWGLVTSDTPYQIKFWADESNYVDFLEETGGMYLADSWVNVKVTSSSPEPDYSEVYVDYANGLDTNDGLSSGNALKTIEQALNKVDDGGVINVAGGVNYLDDVGVNGLTISKNIAIVGVGSNAVIDAQNAKRIFYINGVNVNFTNLVFANANVASASDKRGGAIWASNSVLNIDNCKFINNTGGSSSYGGAINLKTTTTTIKNSYFENNTAWYTGGAINAENNNVLLTISDSVLTNNGIIYNGWSAGGAICAYNTVVINRSQFYNNYLTDKTRNGATINEYTTGSLTITNSILFDGANSVYVATGATNVDNNWWGNTETNKDSNPKDLGYTNANVNSYAYLTLTAPSSLKTNTKTDIGISLVASDGGTVDFDYIPVTVSASKGSFDQSALTLANSNAVAKFTTNFVGSNVITADVMGVTESIDLTFEENYNVGQIVPSMEEIDSGVVSGGVDFISVNPWATTGNLVYTIPSTLTNIKSAIVIVNVYSGSGQPTFALYSNVTLTTKNGLEVLGYETLNLDKATGGDANVYGMNSHTTKQYSDYQMVYDITDKVNGLGGDDTITIGVVDTQYPGKQFDGKIKVIALLLAYDDGDKDNYTYWLNAGQLWTTATNNFNFNTKNYNGKTDNITLQAIALSSTPASQIKINNIETAPDSQKSISYYLDIKFNNISSVFTSGSNTNYWFQSAGISYKTNIALLVASEIYQVPMELGDVYVDYSKGLDTNDGSSAENAVKTIGKALDLVAEGGTIYVASGVNYLDDVGVNGLTISKNIAIVGVGSNAVIDAQNAKRIFYINGFNVNFTNLVFANANVASASDKRGGAIWADKATLNIDKCKFINNTAGASSYGGAVNIKTNTIVTIIDSYFENSTAGYNGGAINVENANDRLIISNSVFTLNGIPGTGWAAGGVISSYGVVTIERSVFYSNVLADGKNGRIINQYGSNSVTITNSILFDGANSVYVATPAAASLDNNWWGNTDVNKDSNPKDLGYTNANVNSYLTLNLTNNDNVVGIKLVSSDGSEVNVPDILITVSATDGSVNPSQLTLTNGNAKVTFTPGTSAISTVTVNALSSEASIIIASEVLDFTNIYVDYNNGLNSNSGTSWDNAVKTIEKALTLVEDDGTIHVADGITYLDDSTPVTGIAINKNVAIVGQSLNAVISGNDAKRIFLVNVGAKLTIRNLTLTQGRVKTGALTDLGGAIYIADGGNTNPIIAGKLDIADSVISNSRTDMMLGGAIGWYRAPTSGISINNVLFINNYAGDSGGAIGSLYDISIGDNCTFIDNKAPRAAALYSQRSITIGNNNRFEHNIATGSGTLITSISTYNINMGTGNVFINNEIKSSVLDAVRGLVKGEYAFFFNNTATRIISGSASSSFENTYWGTNTPDFSAISSSSFTHNTYLVLNVASDKDAIRVGETAIITADLTKNQNGASIDISRLPKDLTLTFTSTNGDVSPVTVKLIDGVATTEYTASMIGTGIVTANIYGGESSVEINLLPPAGTIFVDYANGLDTNDGSDWENAVKTIEKALSIVGDDRIIYVADGVNKLDNLGVNGLTISKNISIVGVGNHVVIDANYEGRIFDMDGLTVNFSNLVFANANVTGADNPRGGAIWAKNSIITIDNCQFINNTAGNSSSSYGGAINLKASVASITNSVFDSNSARSTGAAINVESDNVLLNVSNSIFANNLLMQSGWSAGVAICSYNTVIIDRSVFYNNRLTDNTRNGRSINQYQTGSLTVTNSILLDGEKSVWIASGPTVLENNWWGNTEANKDANPKDLGYTNANVTDYLVLNTVLNKEIGHLGDTIVVTVSLNQNQKGEEVNNVVELPLILQVNLGTIDSNVTSLITQSQATYTPVVTGNEVLKVTVLSIEKEYSFIVKDEMVNVIVDTITTPWSDGVYAGIYNNFTVKVTNNDERQISNLTVELYSEDTNELVAKYVFDTIEKGTTTISLIDPTVRELTKQTVWPDAANHKIRFTVKLKYDDEVVATKSVDKIVAYNGYLNKTYAYGGHDTGINRNYTISGDIIIATQDVSVYMDQTSRFRNETWNIQTPEGAEIVKVFLYFNYNWDTSFFPNGWNLTFNGAEITADYLTHEIDRGNLGGWGAYNYGLLVFDVTDYYNVNAENSFVINKTLNCALYPSTLFVLYNMTDSNSYKDVYFADICDVFYPYYNSVGYDDAIKFVVNFNDINVENLANANWYVFAGSSSSNNNIAFNNDVVMNAFAGRSSDDCKPYKYDVSAFIANNNEAWFISTPQASTSVAYEQVLVVERNKPSAIVNVKAESITFGENATIDIELTSDAEGQVKFNNVIYPVVNNHALINISDLTIGSHIIAVEYTGDNKYSSEIVNVPVIVNAPINFTDNKIVITLNDNATGFVLVEVDGKQSFAEVVNGHVEVPVPVLDEGNYTVAITYTGDGINEPFKTTKDIFVRSNVNDTAIDIPETSASATPTFSIDLPDDATGLLLVDVDGKKYYAELVNGSASITVPNLSNGKYNVSVAYTGDAKYSSITKSTIINVKTPDVKQVIKLTKNTNIKMLYTAKKPYKVLVTKDGKAVSGAKVVFKFNGKKYTVKTNAKGYATFKIPNVKPKKAKYTITASYGGKTVKNTVKINSIVKAKNINAKKSKKVTKIKVTLKKVNAKFLKGKTLKLKFKGKTYKAKTNKKGVATFKLPKKVFKKLKVGKKYKYKVTYGKDTVSKKITIKK